MKVLVACEESQAVCKALEKKDMKRIRVTLLIAVAVILNGTLKVMLCRY